jgi:hypothetical protein
MRTDKQRRNNHINTRKLVPNNCSFIVSVTGFLVAAFSFSANAIEIEAPAIGLSGVPLDYAVSGATPGDPVSLTVGKDRYQAIAQDEIGRAHV